MPPTTAPLLVVEDDAIVRMLIVEVLEEALDYTVIEARDGTAALEVLNNPDQALALMMTDIGLPDMNGQVLAARAREARPLLPILFASGYAENTQVPEGMHLIGKPFSIDQLRDKVQSILSMD